MPFDESFLQEIRDRNRMEDVASSYVTLKRSGSTLKGLCPFHSEKTPSFTVYPQSDSFYCFGCGAGGEVITFIRRIESLDFVEAVRFLADRAGLAMPEDGFDDSLHRLKLRILEMNRLAARYFYDRLLSEEGRPALAYLRERGLSDKTIRHFGLGYAGDSWDGLFTYLKNRHYDPEEMREADLIRKSRQDRYFDRFRSRVMFPIIDLRGNVVAFGGRILPGSEDNAKYINTADTPVFKKSAQLYALNFAKNSGKTLILAEGYMDVIALHQAGFTNAVAALGTSFTAEGAQLITRYADEVVVTMDADEAGRKATARTIQILRKTGVRIRVLRVPDEKDPDEFIRAHGAERFRALLNNADNEIAYGLAQLEAQYDVSSDDGRASFLTAAVGFLSGVGDGITREIYAGRLAERFSIQKDTLLTMIRGNAEKKIAAARKKEMKSILSVPVRRDDINPERNLHRRAASAEEGLISLLVQHPDLREFAEERVKPSDFVTSFNRRLFSEVLAIIKAGRDPTLANLAALFTPEEMGRVTEILSRKNSSENAKLECGDCIRVILEEKEEINREIPQNMSVSELEQQIHLIAERKKSKE